MVFARTAVLRGLGLGCALGLAGCALTAPEPGGVIEVADIINSVKCGLAQALESDAGRRRLPGTIANVELQLKVADTRSAGINSPSTVGPVIIGWYGPLVIPTLTASNQQSFTVDTTINLTYKLDGANASVCAAAGVDTQDKFGFARWLGDVISGLSKVSLQGPRGSLDKLTYDATFAVTREGTAGGSVKVVFLSASASAGAGRADTQHLKIVITNATAASAIASSADGTPVVTRALTPAQVRAIPNLSASPPAQR